MVEEIEWLLKNVYWVYMIEMNDLLLIGLGIVIYCWIGYEDIFIYFEGYGREFIILDFDILCIVGWFMS